MKKIIDISEEKPFEQEKFGKYCRYYSTVLYDEDGTKNTEDLFLDENKLEPKINNFKTKLEEQEKDIKKNSRKKTFKTRIISSAKLLPYVLLGMVIMYLFWHLMSIPYIYDAMNSLDEISYSFIKLFIEILGTIPLMLSCAVVWNNINPKNYYSSEEKKQLKSISEKQKILDNILEKIKEIKPHIVDLLRERNNIEFKEQREKNARRNYNIQKESDENYRRFHNNLYDHLDQLETNPELLKTGEEKLRAEEEKQKIATRKEFLEYMNKPESERRKIEKQNKKLMKKQQRDDERRKRLAQCEAEKRRILDEKEMLEYLNKPRKRGGK